MSDVEGSAASMGVGGKHIDIQDLLVSVILPVHQVEGMDAYMQELSEILEARFPRFEMIVVGPPALVDENLLVETLQRYPHVRYIKLLRDYGIHAAKIAGLDLSIGEVAVVMVPLMDPPEQLPDFVRDVIQTQGVVWGSRSNPSALSLYARFIDRLVHRLYLHFLGIHWEPLRTHFAAFDRRTLTNLLKFRQKTSNLEILTAQVGGPILDRTYIPSPSAPHNGAFATVRRALGVIVANSLRPLRLVSASCFAIACVNVGYVVYIIAVRFSSGGVAPGWAALSFQSAIMFSLLFVQLGVVSEYLGRILVEVNHSPRYLATDVLQTAGGQNVKGELNVVSKA